MGNGSNKRRHVVYVRMSDAELEELDRARGGCPRARFLRSLMLRDVRQAMPDRVEVRCASMDSLVRELNRVGVNVNQLVRLTRGLPVADDAETDAEVLRDGLWDIADGLEQFRNCNDCVRHNEYKRLGLGDDA